jgi:hypothetical protein
MKDENSKIGARLVATRWTPTLAKAGWTPISDFFLDNYHRLGIKHAEAMLIIHLMRHKWDASAPYPGFKSIARKMKISPEATRVHARSLEAKGFLRREKKVGETNRFHLQGLFTELEKLMAADNTAQGHQAFDNVSVASTSGRNNK